MKSGFIFPIHAGGSGSGRGGGSGGAVRLLGGYQVKPRYPELARRLGIEGTVLPNLVFDGTYPSSTAYSGV